jgi:ribosomal protein L11 methyltransferase
VRRFLRDSAVESGAIAFAIFDSIMPYFRLIFSIPPIRYECIIARCLLLDMVGNEEDMTGGRMVLKVYFADISSAEAAAAELSNFGDLSVAALEQVDERDWIAKWRASMKPAPLANGFWVSPLWLPPPASAKHWIKIEPKMAFGTGHHETTRLAAASIIAFRRQINHSRVLDIGTGSGVLCFTADACGASSCLGIEIDPHCRENLAENRRDNAAQGKIAFTIGSISSLNVQAHFDFIVMNMLITESAPLLGATAALLSQKGLLIWSGILTDEADNAIGLARNFGFVLIKKQRENEWWCGAFNKSGFILS